MSASSAHHQVPNQESKDNITSLFGSTTTSEGQGSASTSDMGEKLVAVLMDNAVDPSMLFQLVSASARAKQAFEHQPIAYLKISISCLPPDISQLVVAYMVMIDKGPHTTSWPDEVYLWPQIPGPGQACIFCGSFMLSTWSSMYIDRYFGPESRLPLERLSDPFIVLKKAATVFESIEQLSVSNLWLLMTRELRYHSPEGRLHRISLALWRLEIFCQLYGRSWSQRRWTSTGSAMTPTQEQHRFLHALKGIDIADLIRVYDDLSRMLENVYSQDLGLIFEAQYLRVTKRFDGEPWSSVESRVVDSSVEIFAGYIDYRMSLGMDYLCAVNTARSPDIWPIKTQHYARDNQWTNTFFTAALSGHVHPAFTYRNYGIPRENQFHLQPVDGRYSNDLQSETEPRMGLGLVAANSANTAGWQLKIRYQRYGSVLSTRRLKVPQPLLLGWTTNQHAGGLESGHNDSNRQ